MCVVESVKAASDVFIPVGGTVAEVNARLEDTPELINASAEGEGWICKLTQVNESELDGLMTEEQYQAFVAAKK
jgi:glycine cleavage system H protein